VMVDSMDFQQISATPKPALSFERFDAGPVRARFVMHVTMEALRIDRMRLGLWV